MFDSDLPASDDDLRALCAAIESADVYDVAQISPLERADQLSTALGADVWIKREDAQPVFSFKLRGAYNRIKQLSDAERAAGVVAASAGNHAQGVALAGQALNLRTTIVMPETTPAIKINAVRARGAEVVLFGDAYDAAAAHGKALAADSGRTFIHPYDDPAVMAGQGTIGKEILEQCAAGGGPPPDAIYIPVGGGGLISGVAAWVKAQSPGTEIIGVEPFDAASLHAAMTANERVALSEVGIFADGVAVKQIGAAPFAVAQRCVDHTIQVGLDAICSAMRDLFEANRSIAEPAGALALAGLQADAAGRDLRGKRLVAIESGANVNFDRLQFVAERTALGAQREALLAVTIPEVPGEFLRFCRTIGKRAVTEFNYRYAEAGAAHVYVGIGLQNGLDEKAELIGKLERTGYTVLDMSDNETAKVHVRHMVGGRVSELNDECLFRVQFPERPGALLAFLERLGAQWNISLFHYRNHGAEAGRVLVGVQVPQDQRIACAAKLREIGYRFWNESDNPAYRLFLS